MAMVKSIKLASLASTLLMSALFISACGEHHEEVKAVDKVEEAAKLARANAPEAEKLEFDAPQAGAVDDAAPETTEQVAAQEATVEADDGGSPDNVDAEMAEENAQEAQEAAAEGMTQTVKEEVAQAEATDAGSEPKMAAAKEGQ